MLELSCDFETTKDITKWVEKPSKKMSEPWYVGRVWLGCGVNINTMKTEIIEYNIDDFMNKLLSKSCNVYFHNLAFDGRFIIDWLLKNGYTCLETPSDNVNESTPKIKPKNKTFETLITDMNVYYSIKIYVKKSNQRNNITVTIKDSYKKLPFGVERIGDAFNLGYTKGECDHNKERKKGYIPTKEEIDYCVRDCQVVASALKIQYEKGLDKMTASSDAFNWFKKMELGKRFENFFPVLPDVWDKFIRQSYKGGFTYLNPKHKEEIIKWGCVYDVNSLYPYVMYTKLMPYGIPVKYEGEYKINNNYPLYIHHLRVCFEVKKNHIPTIQLKNNRDFIETEYVKTTDGKIIDLVLTNVDLQLFEKHYNILYRDDVGGFMFKGSDKFFVRYIDYWIEIKKNSKGAMRELAKLMLNSLYGKFGTSTMANVKIPILVNNKVEYKIKYNPPKETIYVALASFVTSYARELTINTAQKLGGRFIYADTDSVHIQGVEPPKINIDSKELGAWKFEGIFKRAKYLRAKTYIEEIIYNDDELSNNVNNYNKVDWLIRCAGLPYKARKKVDIDNFMLGAKYDGKLSIKTVEGGAILQESIFTIKK